MNTQATSRTFIIQVELVPGFWGNGFPFSFKSAKHAGEILERYKASEPDQTFRVASLEG